MASNGRYVMEGCMPEGDLDIASVTSGQILRRSFTFRVNLPPRIQEELKSGDGSVSDPRNFLTGKDGMLFDSDGNPLLAVEEWHLRISFNTEDFQPAGHALVMGITTGYTASVEFTEAVVTDTRVSEILANLRDPGRRESLTFTGVLYGHSVA